MNETKSVLKVSLDDAWKVGRMLLYAGTSDPEHACKFLASLKNHWTDPGLKQPEARPDSAGIVALAKYACPDKGTDIPIRTEFDLSKESMAKLACDIANRMDKARRFLLCFIMCPAEPVETKIQYGEGGGSDLSRLTLGLGATPSGWWQEWIADSFTPDIENEIRVLRDWVACYMPGHFAMFDAQIWNPVVEYYKTMGKQLNASAPWTGALDCSVELGKTADRLGMFCKAINGTRIEIATPLKIEEAKPLPIEKIRVNHPIANEPGPQAVLLVLLENPKRTWSARELSQCDKMLEIRGPKGASDKQTRVWLAQLKESKLAEPSGEGTQSRWCAGSACFD